MIYIGIDPGYSGAIAVIDEIENKIDFIKLSETESEVAEFLDCYVSFDTMCYLEHVHAMPKQGLSSTFKFGTSYGFIRGILIALGVPFETINSSKWQKSMKCRSGGDKKITRAAAQRLFPNQKVIHATADALLIAEYLRRVKCGELNQK